MEDAHTCHFQPAVPESNKPPWGMFAIFDGHVTDKCSAYVAQALPNAIRSWYDASNATVTSATGLPPDAEVQRLALDVDRMWIEQGQEGGSTGVWILSSFVNDRYHLQIGNLGDSRVIVGRQNQTFEWLTRDHKPELPEERARILECGGHVENNRVDGGLAISRAFGDASYKQHAPTTDQQHQKVIAVCDVTHATIEKDSEDFVLIFCDGVYEGDFTNEQIAQFTAKQLEHTSDLAAVCASVCDEALHRGSRDNISCMLIKCHSGIPLVTGHQLDELLPGTFSNPDSKAFVSAYCDMLEYGKSTLSLPQALHYRYHHTQKQLPELQRKFESHPETDLTWHEICAILQPAASQRQALLEAPREDLHQQIREKRQAELITHIEVLQEMKEELERFGSGPGEALDLMQQMEWFEDWAAKHVTCGPADPHGGLTDSTLQQMLAAQQQLGVPLHSLLDMITSQENNPPEPTEDCEDGTE